MANPTTPPSNQLEEENRRLKRAVEELSVLNDLARTIGAARDSQEVMQTIIRRSLRAVHGEQGVITLAEESSGVDGRTLVRTNVSSSSHPRFQAPNALLGWMHLNKKPLILNEPARDDRFRGVVWDEAIASVLCVPLMVKAELKGILTIYNKQEQGGFTMDDQRLLAIIAGQSAQVIENARLAEEEKAYLQMQHDLKLASKIQSDLLPSSVPVIEGYELLGTSIPAKTVGGDYYDFITVDDSRLVVCLGDVSGKGLPASLLMANLQATIRGQAILTPTAAECMRRSNRLSFHSTSPEKFATLFYASLRTDTHTLTYSNAGHELPLLVSPDRPIVKLEAGGIMLGAFEDFPFEEDSVSLQAGDLLVISSDGITEAMDASNNQFGADRLQEVVQQHRAESVAAISEHIFEAVRGHVKGHPQSDDMTLMVIKRTK
jgi:sigma-B regulation protein RsbU (phosphoserine phosphatase)